MLKTLPTLEAVSKELEEVKKAIEVRESGPIVVILQGHAHMYTQIHEAEVAQELAFVKAQAARAQEERIRDAVAATQVRSALLFNLMSAQWLSAGQAEYLEKTAELVTFLRLHSVLQNRQPEAIALNLSEIEGNVIYSITESLFHEIPQGKTEVIRGIFTGEGEHLGIPCKHFAQMHCHIIHWRFA